MKKYLTVVTTLALGALGFAGTAMAAENVAATKHNLSTTGGGAAGQVAYVTTGTDEVCVFCHSPHTEANADLPLWNRATDASGFTMYTSATINMDIATTPQGVSLACLSCHDGTIGFDQLINGPGASNYNPAGASQGYTWNLGLNNMTAVGGVALLGKNLTGDHPISVTYDNTVDTQFKAASAVIAGGLPLYGSGSNQVECGSCHNPHEADLATFYRKSNAGSAICTTCHIK